MAYIALTTKNWTPDCAAKMHDWQRERLEVVLRDFGSDIDAEGWIMGRRKHGKQNVRLNWLVTVSKRGKLQVRARVGGEWQMFWTQQGINGFEKFVRSQLHWHKDGEEVRDPWNNYLWTEGSDNDPYLVR